MTGISCSRILLAALIAAAVPAGAVSVRAEPVAPATLKAAFLFNFAKFTDWSGVQTGAAVVLCVLDDERVGAALVQSVRGQSVDGHGVDVWRLKVETPLPGCHLVFVSGSSGREAMARVAHVADRPIVTVSDAHGFAEAGGMIELFQEQDRMRFAINIDNVQRSGVRLSSRLLDLARIVRSGHVR